MKYKTGKSKIHGYGVFAEKDIRKREFIGFFESYISPIETEHSLCTAVGGKFYNHQPTCGLMYLNHSSKPNAEFDGLYLFAKKKIKKGSEITFYYSDYFEKEWCTRRVQP